jgi:hypothetical protein
MRRNRPSRRQQPDLLVRPPSRSDASERGWETMIDPVAALAELADLLVRGLISQREFARQAAKVIAADGPGGLSAAAPPSCAGRPRPPRRGSRRPACGRSSSGGT